MSYTDQECGYLGLYVPPRDKIIVCAVTLDPTAFEDDQPVIAELLETDEFEHKGGAIDIEVQRRIVGRQLDPVGMRAWEARHLDASYKWPRPRVLIYFEERGKTYTRYARRPPVCREWLATYDLENMLGHPGVWDWFGKVLVNAHIDPESIVSLRVVDEKKVRLDINAPSQPCPGCKYTGFASDRDVDEEEELADDDTDAESGAGRIFGWLSGMLKGREAMVRKSGSAGETLQEHD
ncbi:MULTISPECIES: hypothetical protein [unclassified Paraburkholderia]|uniref:hypothetical protein n=1 Tax=unclassified Paraburkholderia TaxID=2615204 RepID=UPI002AB2A197|nr:MULTISPECIES: hypothetical protein [unclassified Paraburkholderia]